MCCYKKRVVIEGESKKTEPNLIFEIIRQIAEVDLTVKSACRENKSDNYLMLINNYI